MIRVKTVVCCHAEEVEITVDQITKEEIARNGHYVLCSRVHNIGLKWKIFYAQFPGNWPVGLPAHGRPTWCMYHCKMENPRRSGSNFVPYGREWTDKLGWPLQSNWRCFLLFPTIGRKESSVCKSYTRNFLDANPGQISGTFWEQICWILHQSREHERDLL